MLTSHFCSAFEKWRQACLALAEFAHIPVKAAIIDSAKWNDRHEGKQRAKDDVFMAGLARTIEVFGVTVSEVTEVVAATGPMEASEGEGTDPSGSGSVLDDGAGAGTCRILFSLYTSRSLHSFHRV